MFKRTLLKLTNNMSHEADVQMPYIRQHLLTLSDDTVAYTNKDINTEIFLWYSDRPITKYLNKSLARCVVIVSSKLYHALVKNRLLVHNAVYIVLTRNRNLKINKMHGAVANSVNDALYIALGTTLPIVVLGGISIFEQFEDMVSELHLVKFPDTCNGEILSYFDKEPTLKEYDRFQRIHIDNITDDVEYTIHYRDLPAKSFFNLEMGV